MKNALNYYYGIEVENIHQKDKTYYFKLSDNEYVLTVYQNYEEINSIYELSNELIKRGFYCHQIIPNKQNQLLTNINEETYILLKIYVAKTTININDIIYFNNINYNLENMVLRRDNWYYLWTNKIDYIEYQFSQIGKKYFILRESIGYYIGLAENAISLVKIVPNKDLTLSLSHRRVLYKDSTYNLYNPLNFIFDIRIRDVCEYYKDSFFKNKDVVEEIKTFLINNKLNYNESCYFFARLLFPTYYFDVYEKIINNEVDEEEINKIIKKVNEYESLLREIYAYLRSVSSIPEIEWLK